MTIRIVIADDHEIVRIGLRGVLAAAGILVVGESTSGIEAFNLAKQLCPDVVLLDVRMPAGDGISCLSRLKLELPQVQVLMFSGNDNPTYIARSAALGAAGYLTKDVSAEVLVDVIRKVASGDWFWPRETLRRVTGALIAPKNGADTNVQLTKREDDVLRQLANGLTNKEIAQSLGISYETVKEHVQHILRKVGVTDRTQAAVWAVRNQLV